MLTDFVIGLFLLAFVWEGWKNGLLKSLIGPVCAALCCMLAFLIFDLSGNIILAFFVAVIGSVILGITVSIVFMLWRKTVDKDYRDSVFPGSRPAAAVVNLVWLGGITIAAALLITRIPTSVEALTSIQEDISHSRVCEWTSQNVFAEIPLTRRLFAVLSVFKHAARLDEITSSPEFKTFLADPKVKAVAEDPEVRGLFENKNLPALLSHRKVTGLVRDSQVMQKLTPVIKKLYTEGYKKTPAGEKAEEKPATSPRKTPRIFSPEDPGPPSAP